LAARIKQDDRELERLGGSMGHELMISRLINCRRERAAAFD
jgi:hypothetical protein